MLKKNRFILLIFSVTALFCSVLFLNRQAAEKNLYVPYNAHTFFMQAELNDSLATDINSFWINDEVYFVVPYDMPNTCTITIIDENDFSFHDEEVFIDEIKSINDKPIHIVRSNLPIMYISLDNSIYDDPFFALNRQESQKDEYYYGNMILNSSGSIISSSDSNYRYVSPKSNSNKIYNISLSRHGNASWDMCGKHSFNLKLTEKDSLLGLYNSKTYTLIGNGKDKTLLRNYIANELAKKLNCKYTVNMKYVTLYVDGYYRGVYLLTEKPKKVMEKAISKLGEGTFAINVMSIEKDYVIPFTTSNDEFLGNEDQSDGNGISVGLILPEENRQSYEYYSDKVQSLFDEIGTGSFDNVDMESFINYYWVQEVTKNYDAWYRSLYLVYNSDTDKWEAGTPWDFDMSWNYFDTVTPVDFYSPEGLIGSHGIYSDLYLNDDVKKALQMTFKSNVRPALKSIKKEINSTYNYIRNDAILDYEYVNNDRNIPICSEEYFDYVFGTSYDDAYNNFIEFFDARNKFLINMFTGK